MPRHELAEMRSSVRRGSLYQVTTARPAILSTGTTGAILPFDMARLLSKRRARSLFGDGRTESLFENYLNLSILQLWRYTYTYTSNLDIVLFLFVSFFTRFNRFWHRWFAGYHYVSRYLLIRRARSNTWRKMHFRVKRCCDWSILQGPVVLFVFLLFSPTCFDQPLICGVKLFFALSVDSTGTLECET
jgi:hypothetical protein